jgi:hypothetical protein
MLWFVAVLYFDYIPWWGALLISIAVGLISMLLVQFILVPHEKKRVVGELSPIGCLFFVSCICNCKGS